MDRWTNTGLSPADLRLFGLVVPSDVDPGFPWFHIVIPPEDKCPGEYDNPFVHGITWDFFH